MSLESKVGRATLDIAEVAKTKVANGLLEARSQNNIEISDEDLGMIMQHVNAALDVTFSAALPALQKVLKDDSR